MLFAVAILLNMFCQNSNGEFIPNLLISKTRVMILKIKKELPYLAMLLPSFLVYSILLVLPIILTLLLSLSDWNGGPITNIKFDFAGIQNYTGILQDNGLLTVLKNTILYALLQPLGVTVLAIPLAMLLCTSMKTRNFQRAVFFFPSVPSPLILGYLWAYILSSQTSGVVNQAITSLGGNPVPWLSNSVMAMVSVLIVGIWSQTGWHACIYIAQIQSIPEEYYEAAKIDGAGWFCEFRHITLPMLRPAFMTSSLLLLLNALKVFELPYALTSGGPGYSTTMFTQIIIQRGFIDKMYGRATAASILFGIFVAAVGYCQQHFANKEKKEIV